MQCPKCSYPLIAWKYGRIFECLECGNCYQGEALRLIFEEGRHVKLPNGNIVKLTNGESIREK